MDIAALPLRYAGANTGESLGWYQCLKRDVMACCRMPGLPRGGRAEPAQSFLLSLLAALAVPV